MYFVKSKIGPSEVFDTSRPDQRRMGLYVDGNGLWSKTPYLMNPLSKLKYLST